MEDYENKLIPDNLLNDTQPEKKHKTKKSGGFESMNLIYPVYRAVKSKGFNVPTPIQRKAIPHLLEGRDIVACARTGSGKTAAFIIPMVNRLKEHSSVVGARALIILPTRELALQVITKKPSKTLKNQQKSLKNGKNLLIILFFSIRLCKCLKLSQNSLI